ncbi:hypothetical protein NQ317_009003 [Molorchus minor]|uniref:Uncharacterized protein n=1 Tax=Molorchus minor TaxID=1323400 RepID=A0ABQ9JKX2_9CUCU|nr:hypothetical protein NQ317_009003 [Molorchus minor]
MTEEFKEVDDIRKPSKKVRFEEFLNDSIIHTNNYDIVSDDEHIMSPLDITSTEDEISNYGTPAQSPKSSRKHKQMANQQSNTSFAEQVNKIIKRVEDIYSQLDDMQNTSSEENVQKPKQKEEVKVFKEDDKKFKENVIKSDAYLTPFMQAVKEKRRAPEKNIQQSPSYYNVINFLDSLKDIQNETPIEVHTARLCYHVNVYHQPMVFDQAKMEHTTELLPAIESSKPEILRITSNGGCQKKTEGATKIQTKKVSKEDKSSQATVCAYHRKKLLRISSQQFPPSEKDTEQQTSRPPSQNESKMEQSTSFDNNILHQNCNNFVTPDSTDTAKNLPTEINNLDIPTTISPNLPSVEENIHENKGDENKIEKQISSVSSEQPILSNEQLLSKEDNETKNSSSEQSDNAVQVYCHVLEDGKSKTEEIVKPSTTSGNESTLKEDKNVGSCENRSYLPLSKKDRSNQAIFLTHKDICTDESINVNIDVCTEKGINTDQMESSQSTEVEYSNENSAISLFADSGRLGPKVVKECIDLRDGNYGPESVLHVKNSLQKLNQPKIVIFREVSKVANLLKPLQDLNSTRLLKKRPNGTELKLVKRPIINLIQTHGIKEIKTWGENVVLLKSFYAIVYILMFTALSLEYRCICIDIQVNEGERLGINAEITVCVQQNERSPGLWVLKFDRRHSFACLCSLCQCCFRHELIRVYSGSFEKSLPPNSDVHVFRKPSPNMDACALCAVPKASLTYTSPNLRRDSLNSFTLAGSALTFCFELGSTPLPGIKSIKFVFIIWITCGILKFQIIKFGLVVYIVYLISTLLSPRSRASIESLLRAILELFLDKISRQLITGLTRTPLKIVNDMCRSNETDPDQNSVQSIRMEANKKLLATFVH